MFWGSLIGSKGLLKEKYFFLVHTCQSVPISKLLLLIFPLQGVGFSFLSLLWQPDVEIHHVRSIKEPKVMINVIHFADDAYDADDNIITKGAVIVMMIKTAIT